MDRDSRKRVTERILEEVLRRTTPGRKERDETLQFSEELEENLASRLKSAGIRADVHVQGSIAKDTWLSGEKDIDLFISLQRTGGKEIFSKVLNVVKSFAGERWIEAYAEHPYIQAEIKGYKIDFVPCFNIEKAEEAGSSVDRTPLHTSYVKGHLNQQFKDEVRLFKQFTRGIDAYGAEIKVKGLSGYLCELIIIHYQSFLRALQAVASWQIGEIIDLENLHGGRAGEVKRIFNAPLNVVDPVDANRNVAAAVSEDKLGELIMAARLFLAKPDIHFFFPDETVPLSADTLIEKMARFDMIFMVFKGSERVPDVLWGQLYKTSQAFKRFLSQNDFQVLRDAVWSDEREVNILVFGLESRTIPQTKKHLGPPVDSKEAASFIEKYIDSDLTTAGPLVEEGRWIVCVRRRFVDAASLLKENSDEIMNIGVPSGLAPQIKESKIYVCEEIIKFYISNPDFARFLTDFIRGKPKWMK